MTAEELAAQAKAVAKEAGLEVNDDILDAMDHWADMVMQIPDEDILAMMQKPEPAEKNDADSP
jgi:hypothetical protein